MDLTNTNYTGTTPVRSARAVTHFQESTAESGPMKRIMLNYHNRKSVFPDNLKIVASEHTIPPDA